MSIKYLILGWIRKCPTHGYSIKKCFQEFVNPDVKLNDAKLYPLLREMEQGGLVEKEVEEKEIGPSRKIVRITEKGSKEFQKWLASDEGENNSGRPRYDFFRALPFLIKFSFCYELDDESILRKISAQRLMHEEKLNDFLLARENMIQKKLEVNKIQIIDFGIVLEKTILAWLDEVSKYYRKGRNRSETSEL
jgi:DNA-binding PadR family transcriptional regulator